MQSTSFNVIIYSLHSFKYIMLKRTGEQILPIQIVKELRLSNAMTNKL